MEFVRTRHASYTQVGELVIEIRKGLIRIKERSRLQAILTINTVAGMSVIPLSSRDRAQLLQELIKL